MTIVSRDRESGYLNPGDPGYELMPTLDEIITIKHDYMEYYENFHKQSVAEETYYFGENIIPEPTLRGSSTRDHHRRSRSPETTWSCDYHRCSPPASIPQPR